MGCEVVTRIPKERIYVNIFLLKMCEWIWCYFYGLVCQWRWFFLFLCRLNPEGRFSFWLHLRLYREVRVHGQLQNNIPVFQLKDCLPAHVCLSTNKNQAGFSNCWVRQESAASLDKRTLDECEPKFNKWINKQFGGLIWTNIFEGRGRNYWMSETAVGRVGNYISFTQH